MLNMLLLKINYHMQNMVSVEAILHDYDVWILFEGAVRSVLVSKNVSKFEADYLFEYATHTKFFEMTSSDAYFSFHHLREEGLKANGYYPSLISNHTRLLRYKFT